MVNRVYNNKDPLNFIHYPPSSWERCGVSANSDIVCNKFQIKGSSFSSSHKMINMFPGEFTTSFHHFLPWHSPTFCNIRIESKTAIVQIMFQCQYHPRLHRPLHSPSSNTTQSPVSIIRSTTYMRDSHSHSTSEKERWEWDSSLSYY